MTVPVGVFKPLLDFLAGQTAAEAKAEWPKGPTASYRTAQDIPVMDYVQWVRNVETSPALAGSSAKQVVQRVRRLYFSQNTEIHKPGVGNRADKHIDRITPQGPPLTTDQVDLATLNGLYGTSTIRTASGISVDVGHLWLPLDLALAGRPAATFLGEVFYLDSDLEALFSWAGDLGGVANTWSQQAARVANTDPSGANRDQLMLDLVNAHCARDDLLGDMDGVILGRHWKSKSGLVVSAALEEYYKDDALPQSQAKILAHPNSARRFHHFLRVASPSLPASGKTSTPLEVSVVRASLRDALAPIVLDAADDLVGAMFSAPDIVARAGRAHFDKLCDNFAKFLEAGLTNPNAPWPPSPW